MCVPATAANVGVVATASIRRHVRPRGRRRPRAAAVQSEPTAAAEPDASAEVEAMRFDGPVTLQTVASRWWSALDLAEAAVRAADSSLATGEVRTLRARLSTERASTVRLLENVARAERVPAQFNHLLTSRSSLRSLLGLPSTVRASATAAGARHPSGGMPPYRRRPGAGRRLRDDARRPRGRARLRLQPDSRRRREWRLPGFDSRRRRDRRRCVLPRRSPACVSAGDRGRGPDSASADVQHAASNQRLKEERSCSRDSSKQEASSQA